ncbi:winged helix-turn-helix transcriptional regulator [Candidatus Bathyarchaeota archaeon]|nr:winged helix-turn-helix transcriptional regulator [Candidatus Bathyarchaeota archaeon]
MDLAKLSISGLLERMPKAPHGILRLSAAMKHAVKQVQLDEGQRDQILLLLSRGIDEPQEYLKISHQLLHSIESVSKEELAVDYFHCILGKAFSEIFRKRVPKLRNERARTLFLLTLTGLYEIAHRPLSAEALSTFLGQKTDEAKEVAYAVVEEANHLVDRKWLPELELPSCLEKAQSEFIRYVEDMEELTGCKRGSVGKYQEDPQVCSFFDPWYLEEAKTMWWGVQYYPIINVLNVQPQYLYFDSLRRGLLAREAARLFSPRILDKMERVYEQADYCAYRILENPFEKELWIHARHGLRTESKAFDGIHFYEEWESIIGNNFIKLLFSRMKSISRFRASLEFAEYEAIVDALALKPKPAKINENELKILRLLCNDPWTSLTKIAQKTGLTVPTVEKIFHELWIRANIWFSVLVDRTRIGIPSYLAIIHTKPGKVGKVSELVWDTPYCGRIYRMYSPPSLLAHFNIPTGYEWFLNQQLSLLNRADLTEGHHILRIEDSYYNFNLRYYDPKTARWSIPWDEWGLWLKEFLCGKSWFLILHGEEEKKTTEQVKVDKNDLQILNYLRLNSRMPNSEIGRILGISGAYVGQKIRRLLNLGIIKPTIGSYRVGLDEAAFVVFDCYEDTLRAVAVALNELPMWQGFRVSGDFDGLAALIFVPTGELEELFNAFHEYLIEPGLVNRCFLNMVEKWTGKRREPPVELFSNESGWLFEGEKYLDRLKTALRSL